MFHIQAYTTKMSTSPKITYSRYLVKMKHHNSYLYNTLLTLVLRFYFYAHVLRLGVIKPPREFKSNHNKFLRFQLHTGVFDHGEFKESDCENDRQPEIAVWPPKPEIIIYL